MLRSYADILTALSAPIPEEHIKKVQRGQGKGGAVQYIPWWYVVQRLNQDAPGWSSEPVEVREVCGQLLVKMRLTLATLDGEFTQYGLGFEEDPDDENFGGPIPKAYATGIKRAAVLFGLGLAQLYGKSQGAAPPPKHLPQRTHPDMTRPPAVAQIDRGEAWHAKYEELQRQSEAAGFLPARVTQWLRRVYKTQEGRPIDSTRELTEEQLDEAIMQIVAQAFDEDQLDWFRRPLPDMAVVKA